MINTKNVSNLIQKHFKIHDSFALGIDNRCNKLKYKNDIKKIVDNIYYLDNNTIIVLEIFNKSKIMDLLKFCIDKKYLELYKYVLLNLK